MEHFIPFPRSLSPLPGRQGFGPEHLSRTRCAVGCSPSVLQKHPHKTGAIHVRPGSRRLSAPNLSAESRFHLTPCGDQWRCRICLKCTITDSAVLSADNGLTLSYSWPFASGMSRHLALDGYGHTPFGSGRVWVHGRSRLRSWMDRF